MIYEVEISEQADSDKKVVTILRVMYAGRDIDNQLNLHTKIQNKCRYMCVHCQNEGKKELMPVYCVIGKIPIVRNISNKIIVLENKNLSSRLDKFL